MPQDQLSFLDKQFEWWHPVCSFLKDWHSPHHLTNFLDGFCSAKVFSYNGCAFRNVVSELSHFITKPFICILLICLFFFVSSAHYVGIKMEAYVIREETSSYVSLKTCNLGHSIIQTRSIMPIFYASKAHSSYLQVHGATSRSEISLL